MKKIVMMLAAVCMLYACTNTQEQEKKQEKEALDDILKVHDKVMGQSEVGVKNKMRLDTIIKANKIPQLLSQEVEMRKKLTDADDVMENWMQSFKADYGEKSHAEIMTYLVGQKKEILKVDSAIRGAIDDSNKFLQTVKSKP